MNVPSLSREASQAALERLAARQHAIARAAASGAAWRDLAALAGLSGIDAPSRLAALLNRPAMRELIAAYQRAA